MILEADAAAWCDETLPELYDNGMFDSEEISDDVWEAVAAAIEPLVEDNDDDDTDNDTEQLLTDAALTWFHNYHTMMLELIQPVPQTAITALCDKPQTAQHTADWYAQRRNRLTASEFSQILDGKRGSLLRQKTGQVTGDRQLTAPIGISQPDGEMNATTWGHRFEPITRRIYELEIAGVDTVNDTLGRFTHRSIPWLSASPDGLVIKGPLAGRLIEIKSPKSRQPGEYVPSEYYVQMQVQMEVCDVDAVEFVEAQFAQLHVTSQQSETDRVAIDAASWKGKIQIRGFFDDTSTWRTFYSEPVNDIEDATFASSSERDDLPLLEESVWWLKGFYPRTVLRNRAWWESTGLPNAELFWAEVQSIRTYNEQGSNQVTNQGTTPITGWLGSSS